MAKKIKINEKKFNEDYETAEVIYKSFLKSLRKLGNRAMHSPFPVVKAAEMIIASCLLASEKVFKVHPSKKDYDELFKAIPRVQFRQASSNNAGGIELSDYDKAVERGKAIAAIVNGKKED